MRLKFSSVSFLLLILLFTFNCQAAMTNMNSGLINTNRIEDQAPNQSGNPSGKIPALKKTTLPKRSKVFIGDKDAALAPFRAPCNWEVYGAIGIVNIRAQNSILQVASDETDRLAQTNKGHWGTAAQLGIGYKYFWRNRLPFQNHVQWFPFIEPQLNVNFFTTGIKGKFRELENPVFTRNYKMPISSARIMADGALTVASINRLSIYGKGGIGSVWNTIQYAENQDLIAVNTRDALTLNGNHRTQFAWEAGSGLTYNFTDCVALSLEYLYADIGKIKLASNGVIGEVDPVVRPSQFKLHTQSLLLALRIGF